MPGKVEPSFEGASFIVPLPPWLKLADRGVASTAVEEEGVASKITCRVPGCWSPAVDAGSMGGKRGAEANPKRGAVPPPPPLVLRSNGVGLSKATTEPGKLEATETEPTAEEGVCGRFITTSPFMKNTTDPPPSSPVPPTPSKSVEEEFLGSRPKLVVVPPDNE